MAEIICRGVRGAITVDQNNADEILEASKTLLQAMVAENEIVMEDICSAIFTVTPDLSATFPSAAARQMGWQLAPLLNAQEIPVPGALERTIRILLLWNTTRTLGEIRHIYLRGAISLRPDLATGK